LGPRPNAAYLVDAQGNIAFRSLTSNDERVLREGLYGLVAGTPLPIGECEPRVIPTLKAIGVMRTVLELAGQDAKQDFRRELPGVYPLLCLAALFSPLPPLARGIAAIASSGGGLIAVLGSLAWLRKHQNQPSLHLTAPGDDDI